MTISVVQSKTVLNPGSGAGSFNSATTAGNCVVVLIFTYATTNVTISTSAVTLGGSGTGFSQAKAVQSGFASSDTQYIGCWVQPDTPGGQTAVAATVANAIWTSGAGLILLELSGVATSSPVDVTSSGNATSGTAVTSGTTGATAVAGEMAIGAAYPDNALSAESGTYTNILLGSSSPYIGAAGYLTLASTGSTTSYTGTGASSGDWAGLVITLKPASAPAGLSVIQAASASTRKSAASSVTLTFVNPTTAGNCIVVCAGNYSTASGTDLTGITLGGSAGNFGKLISVPTTSALNQGCAIWADPDCAGGQTSVVVTLNGTHALSAVAYEVSGLVTSAVLDQSSASSGTSGSSWTSGTTGMTTLASEAWFGVASVYNAFAAEPSAWVNTEPAGDDVDLLAGYQIAAAAGEAVYAGSQTAAGTWSAAAVTLKASVSAPAGPGAARPVTAVTLAGAARTPRQVTLILAFPF